MSTDIPPLAHAFRPVVYGSPDYDAMLALRHTALRAPLGLTFTAEDLLPDSKDYLFCLYTPEQDTPAGCLILQPAPDGWMRLRQVAVAPHCHGRGIGSAMLAAADSFARNAGYTHLYCLARDDARNFYLKNGWIVQGPGPVLVGLPHTRMEKTL